MKLENGNIVPSIGTKSPKCNKAFAEKEEEKIIPKIINVNLKISANNVKKKFKSSSN